MGCRGCRVALVVSIIGFFIISFAIVSCYCLMNAFVLVIVAIAIAIIIILIILLIIIHPIHIHHLLYQFLKY